MQKEIQLLLGTWQLVPWVLIDTEGKIHFPYGEDAKGHLSYMDSGLMSVHLMRNQRPLFESPSVFEITPAEALQSYNDYVSYCGSYEVQRDYLLHHVQMHTCPNWVGSVQKRYFKFDGDCLHLSHTLENKHMQLVWQKMR